MSAKDRGASDIDAVTPLVALGKKSTVAKLKPRGPHFRKRGAVALGGGQGGVDDDEDGAEFDEDGEDSREDSRVTQAERQAAAEAARLAALRTQVVTASVKVASGVRDAVQGLGREMAHTMASALMTPGEVGVQHSLLMNADLFSGYDAALQLSKAAGMAAFGPAASGTAGAGSADSPANFLSIGARVQGKVSGGWYDAKVTGVHRDAKGGFSCDVEYDDGETDNKVPLKNLRPATNPAINTREQTVVMLLAVLDTRAMVMKALEEMGKQNAAIAALSRRVESGGGGGGGGVEPALPRGFEVRDIKGKFVAWVLNNWKSKPPPFIGKVITGEALVCAAAGDPPKPLSLGDAKNLPLAFRAGYTADGKQLKSTTHENLQLWRTQKLKKLRNNAKKLVAEYFGYNAFDPDFESEALLRARDVFRLGRCRDPARVDLNTSFFLPAHKFC